MKKFLSTLLAVMLLALPVLGNAEGSVGVIGGADGPTTLMVDGGLNDLEMLTQSALDAGRRVTTKMKITGLTGLDTTDAASDAALLELLAGLGLVIEQQGDEFEFALTFNDEELLTFAAASSGEDLYIGSNLLGRTVVLGKSEAEPLLDRLVDVMVGFGMMTAEEAETTREELAAFADYMSAAAEAGTAATLTAADLAQLNLTALEQFDILARDNTVAIPAEEIVIPRMCDMAVSGEKLVLTNEDMVVGMKAILQFLLDNPKLMEYIGSNAGYPTEATLDLAWQSYGELYMAFGIYEDEAAFRADQPTFRKEVETMMASLDGQQPMNGEFVSCIYYDAEGRVVYLTASLPLHSEEAILTEDLEQTVVPATVQIDAVYTRQTVASGVAHVCNLTVDGETITLDILEQEDGMTLHMNSLWSDGYTEELVQASVKYGQEGALELLDAEGVLYSEGRPLLSFQVAGEAEASATRNYMSGNFAMTTTYTYTGEADALVAVENTVQLDFTSDIAINGVDFSGTGTYVIHAADISFGLACEYSTGDPEPSIMAGEVVRPAELNDNDFRDWFAGVLNQFGAWMGNAVNLLPESVLTLFISTGMTE